MCGRVLNQYTGSFGQTWVHALEEDNDHPAVPVPAEGIRTIKLCDFCLAPDAAWVLPVEDYLVGTEGRNVGDWQGCDGCGAFLERGDWNELTQRALDALRGRGETDGIEPEIFQTMYGQLREHITGPVRLAP